MLHPTEKYLSLSYFFNMLCYNHIRDTFYCHANSTYVMLKPHLKCFFIFMLVQHVMLQPNIFFLIFHASSACYVTTTQETLCVFMLVQHIRNCFHFNARSTCYVATTYKVPFLFILVQYIMLQPHKKWFCFLCNFSILCYDQTRKAFIFRWVQLVMLQTKEKQYAFSCCKI